MKPKAGCPPSPRSPCPAGSCPRSCCTAPGRRPPLCGSRRAGCSTGSAPRPAPAWLRRRHMGCCCCREGMRGCVNHPSITLAFPKNPFCELQSLFELESLFTVSTPAHLVKMKTLGAHLPMAPLCNPPQPLRAQLLLKLRLLPPISSSQARLLGSVLFWTRHMVLLLELGLGKRWFGAISSTCLM